jgi:isoquinoline 1-oxidoreductase beta subunit
MPLHARRADTESVADGGSSRRKFLKATTSLGGGLLLSFALPALTRNAKAADTVGAEGFAPNGFVRVNRDGRVILTMPQAEMGQGTYTSMSMLIAEELEVGIDQIHLEPAPPDDKVYANSVFAGIQVTGGSTSVRVLGATAPGRATARDHARVGGGTSLGCG